MSAIPGYFYNHNRNHNQHIEHSNDIRSSKDWQKQTSSLIDLKNRSRRSSTIHYSKSKINKERVQMNNQLIDVDMVSKSYLEKMSLNQNQDTEDNKQIANNEFNQNIHLNQKRKACRKADQSKKIKDVQILNKNKEESYIARKKTLSAFKASEPNDKSNFGEQNQKEEDQKKKISHKRENNTFYLLKRTNFLRKVILKTLQWRQFDQMILLLIVLNSLIFAVYDYSDRSSSSMHNQILDIIGQVLTYIFLFECILKILGYGFIMHKGAYLRDCWNVIDFTVVISGILEEELSSGSVRLKSLRVLRVLRPLRSINAIPSMRKLITALIHAVPDFFNVAIFLLFIFLLFAILGVHQYNGILYNQCVYSDQSMPLGIYPFDQTRVCTQSLGQYKCPSNMYCANLPEIGISLEDDTITMNKRINFGLMSFDNIGSSLFTVFQIITTEQWITVMLNLMDADVEIFAVLYCFSIIIICTFFLMNLILAVIIQAFIKIQKQELEKEMLGISQFKSNMMKPTAKLKESVESRPSTQKELARKNIGTQRTKKSIQRVRTQFKANKGLSKEEQMEEMQEQSLKEKSLIYQAVKGALDKSGQTLLLDQSGKFSNNGGSVGNLSIEVLQKERKADFSFLKKITQSKNVLNAFKESMTPRAGGSDPFTPKSERLPLSPMLGSSKFKRVTAFPSAFNSLKNSELTFESRALNQTNSLMNENLKHKMKLAIKEEHSDFDSSSKEEDWKQNDDWNEKVAPRINLEVPQGNFQAISTQKINQERMKLEMRTELIKLNEPTIKIPLDESEMIRERIIEEDEILKVQDIEEHEITRFDISPRPKEDYKINIINDTIITNTNDKSRGETKQQFNQDEKIQNDPTNDKTGIIDEQDDVSSHLGNNQFNDRPKDAIQRTAKSGISIVGMQKRKQAIQEMLQNSAEDQEAKNNIDFKNLLDKAKIKSKDESKVQQNNLRALAHQRLSMKVKRQKNNLIKQVEIFKIEDRAESNCIYNICYKLVRRKFFQRMISLFIILNTVDLAMDRYPIDKYETIIIDEINIALSVIFMLEMVIQLLALGIRSYFKDSFNVFDSVIVFSSIIDMLVSLSISTNSSGSAITALRAFRLIRVFKLAKSWKQFQNLLKTMGRTLKDISTFTILLFLFMFIYTLLGMELFAYKAKVLKDGYTLDNEAGKSPDSNFDYFLSSFSSVFIILTNDGWVDIYLNYARTAGNAVSIIYFVSLILIGQKILLNLFLAILLENFDEESLSQEIKESKKKKKKKKKKQKCLDRIEESIRTKLRRYKLCRKLFKLKKGNSDFSILDIKNQSQMKNELLDQENQIEISQDFFYNQNSAIRLMSNQESKFGKIQRQDGKRLLIKEDDSSDEPQMYGTSLYYFPQTSKFRKLCFSMVTNTKFDWAILTIIMISCVQLALDNPLNDPDSHLQVALLYVDISTTVIFCLEAAIKIIAFGFILNKQAYVRISWNALDFLIIVFSVLSLTPLPSDLKIFKIFRVLRVLRLVNRNEGLQLAVKALLKALPQVANVTLIMLLFFVIFGIIAISYFKGEFYDCDLDAINFKYQTPLVKKWDCLNIGGNWRNKQYSFDNIFAAMQTLFQLATTTAWGEVMYICINSSEIDSFPVKNNNEYWTFFFILFIIVGSFFLLNLFVGVVISTFNREKDKIGGNNLLTDRQKNWIDAKIIAIKAKPKKLLLPPQNWLRKMCFLIYDKNWFINSILGVIIANTLTLTLKWYDEPQMLEIFTENLNYLFTAIFMLEAIIKIMAIGRHYFRDSWNIFDFTILLGSLISIFLTQTTSFSLGGATTIMRAFRITRIFRLVNQAQNLKIVFNTFIFTLPQLANVGSLLILTLYLYSIVGIYLFAEVKRNGNLGDNLNFESFPSAFLTLFTISTGCDWDLTVYSTLKQKSVDFDCITNPSYYDYRDSNFQTVGCGDNVTSGIIYYYSYIVFVNLIFLNLFIAIILQGFDDTQAKEQRSFKQETLEKFRDAWAKFDPDATTYIKIFSLPDFMIELGKPLGWDISFKEKQSQQDDFIEQLDLPIYNNFSDYMFMDVLEALALRLVVQEQMEKEREARRIEKEREDSLLMDHSLGNDASSNHFSKEDLKEEEIDEINEKKRAEQLMKADIQKDLNKLQFQQAAQKIKAVKEVKDKMMKSIRFGIKQEPTSHFTSLHQRAAKVAVQHMKYVVAKKKLLRQIEELKREKQEVGMKNIESEQLQIEIDKNHVDAESIMEFEDFMTEKKQLKTTLKKKSLSNNTGQSEQNCMKPPVIQNCSFENKDKDKQSSSSSSEKTNKRQHKKKNRRSKQKVKPKIIQKIYQNVSINANYVSLLQNPVTAQNDTQAFGTIYLYNVNQSPNVQININQTPQQNQEKVATLSSESISSFGQNQYKENGQHSNTTNPQIQGMSSFKLMRTSSQNLDDIIQSELENVKL